MELKKFQNEIIQKEGNLYKHWAQERKINFLIK